eukprot:g16296.t1
MRSCPSPSNAGYLSNSTARMKASGNDHKSVKQQSNLLYYSFESTTRKVHVSTTASESALCVEFRGDSSEELLMIFLPGVDEDVQYNLNFAKLAKTFASSAVLAGIDYPGHGRSSGKRGVLPSANELLNMLEAVISEIITGRGGGSQKFSQFVLVGHSLGGLLATLLSNLFQQKQLFQRKELFPGVYFVGAILLAPALDTLVDGAFLCCSCECCCSDRHCCSLLAPAWCGIYQLLECLVVRCGCTCLLPEEKASNYLTMPPEEQALLQKSLAVDRMTPEATLTLLDLMKRVQRPENWVARECKAPLCVVTGTKDTSVPYQSILAFARARRLTVQRITDLKQTSPAKDLMLVVPGASHQVLAAGVQAQGGGTERDVVEACVLPSIAQWLTAARSVSS